MNENNKPESAAGAGFDFDVWERLARLDPVEFERQRELAIARFVEKVGSDREAIEALRGRIETMRERNAAPMENLQWLAGEMIFALQRLAHCSPEKAQRESDSLH